VQARADVLREEAVPVDAGVPADGVEADEGWVATARRHEARLPQHVEVDDGHLLLLVAVLALVRLREEGLHGKGLAARSVARSRGCLPRANCPLGLRGTARW
jgi:hypothetical protein